MAHFRILQGQHDLFMELASTCVSLLLLDYMIVQALIWQYDNWYPLHHRFDLYIHFP